MTDPKTWELCLAVLMDAGHKELSARRIVGVWLRDYAEQDVVDAITSAAGKVDPVAYTRRILKAKPCKGRLVQNQLKLDEPAPAPREVALEAIRRGINVLKGRTA